MRPTLVIPLVAISGITLVFGCSYDWNVASQGDGGAAPVATSASSSGATGSSGLASSSSSSSASSSGTTPPRDAGATDGNCGNNCTCKAGEKCTFGCVAKRTCRLVCEKDSDCKFTCPTGASCEVTCEKGAKCDWTTEPQSEITLRCGDKPTTCTGGCALASECTNKCDKDECTVACIGLPICNLHD